MTEKYKKAGVDIDAGNRFVENIKPLIKSTKRRGMMAGIGGFGGLFALNTADIEEPVLVCGTDGVGTKLKMAIEMGKLDTIGQDLVAMCVNDIACSGAEPLLFLDYFAMSKLKPDEHTAVVAGIASACKATNCALIGGETAEMPDIYQPGDFDLAGFAVGIVDRKKIIDGSDIGAGNSIIGLASSGFHSNGYALVRSIVRERGLDLNKKYDGFERTLGEMLIEPTELYSPIVQKLSHAFHIKGIAHITGGGFWDNIPRILPAGVQAVIAKKSWPVPHLFRFFAQQGEMDENEMFRVFNCGIGMVFVVPNSEGAQITDALVAHGKRAYIIGHTRAKPKAGAAIVIE